MVFTIKQCFPPIENETMVFVCEILSCWKSTTRGMVEYIAEKMKLQSNKKEIAISMVKLNFKY